MSERRAIIEFLRSDLYERLVADATGIEFTNPAFRVRISGESDDPTVEAWRLSTGEHLFRLEHATVERVNEALP